MRERCSLSSGFLAAGCRFSFKAPAPEQLEVSAVMGNVLLRDAHRLDFETEPEMEFTVVVTRVDDVACELRCIVLSVHTAGVRELDSGSCEMNQGFS